MRTPQGDVISDNCGGDKTKLDGVVLPFGKYYLEMLACFYSICHKLILNNGLHACSALKTFIQGPKIQLHHGYYNFQHAGPRSDCLRW